MRQNIITLLLMPLVIFDSPLVVYARSRDTLNNTNVVRDTQLLLSLNRFYTGPLDGQCNAQTQQAIEKYEGTLTNSPPGISCSVQFLERLRDKLIVSLTTETSKPHDTTSQNTVGEYKIESLAADITKIKSDLATTMSEIRGINERISTHFITLAYNIATVLITSFLAAISIVVVVGNIVMKNRIEELHNAMLEGSKTTLLDMIANYKKELVIMSDSKDQIIFDAEMGKAEIQAPIYTSLALNSITMYEDLPDPAGRHKNIYNKYLDTAVHMANFGYVNAVEMERLLKARDIKPSKAQKEVIENCINNYVFCVSSRGREEDMQRVVQVLPELEKIRSEGQTNRRWFDFIDTLAWANLHLKRSTAQQTKDIVQALMDDNAIPVWWKQQAKERYDFYNKSHLGEDKVNLQIRVQNLS